MKKRITLRSIVWLLLVIPGLPDSTGTQASVFRGMPVNEERRIDTFRSLTEGVAHAREESSPVDDAYPSAGKLVAPDAAGDDEFGFSVAISGNTAIVGAPYDDVAFTDQGSAHVYVRSGGNWMHQAKLVAVDGSESAFFGLSVAISGDIALIGAPGVAPNGNSRQGGAYVFTRSGNNWGQQARLTAGDGAIGDHLGYSVSLSGTTALVGAPGDDQGMIENQGSAYVFVRSIAAPLWTQQARLTFADGGPFDNCGLSVALSGSTAVVGIPEDDFGNADDQGSAVVFVRSGTAWSQQDRLIAPDGAADDNFSGSVAISGDTVVIGSGGDDTGMTTDHGSAYVFTRSGTTWTQQAKLLADDGRSSDGFGTRVSVSNHTALIGAIFDSSGTISFHGSAYYFNRLGTTWRQSAKVIATDRASDDGFGSDVAIAGNLSIAGAYHADGSAIDQGAAYTFINSSSAPFDFDGDGKTDVGIFRASTGEWWINRSSNGTTFAAQFGAGTDRLVPGDYTGDGKTDIGVWRPSTGEWLILRSENSSFFAFPFGTNGDIPVPADYDGLGDSEPAVFRPSNGTWFITGFVQSNTTLIRQFGSNGDIPVPGDYDGIGTADVGIYRPSNGQWWLHRPDTIDVLVVTFGTGSDKPVPGDYTGDGFSDAAFWRPSTGEWFILRSEDFSFFSFPFGANGDIPAPGDYDGDGRFDATVFRPSSGTWFSQRSNAGLLIQQFGTSGDRPIPNAFVP